MKVKKEIYFVKSKLEAHRLNLKFNPTEAKQQLIDMGYKKAMSFLDVGCGTGIMGRVVSNYDVSNKNIVGMDMSPDMVEVAERQAKEEKKTNLRYVSGNAYKMPFDDNSFDFVWSRFLLEHLSDPLKVLNEIKRVVKKNGIIAVGDLDGNCLFHYPMSSKFENYLQKIIAVLQPYGFDPFIGRKLYHFMLKTGMRNVKIKMYPYHNISGKPNKTDFINWKIKIDSTIQFIKKNNLIKKSTANDIGKIFMNHIKDKEVFTYSTLMFASGKK